MPVRLRITLLFALLVFVILSLVCSGVYYFFHQSRLNTIKTRLTNRGMTTARLLSQREVFDRGLVQRIDSATTISLKNKTVQAYDYQNRKIYQYNDQPGDTMQVETEILDDARVNGTRYFKTGNKEAVAYHHADSASRLVVVSAATDADGLERLSALAKILLVFFLVGNVLVLVAGYFFSRGLLLPVRKITEDVEEISAHNLTRRISTGGSKDEWYQLAHTLNRLLNRLQESFEWQRRFISNASHELSTPLTVISSQLEVSLQRERGAEDYRRVMQSIYQDVQRMSRLTQTLLEMAKASGSAGGLDFMPVRLDEILMELPAQAAGINPQFTVTIQFDELPESDEELLVYGNEPLLSTAIKNIVINACKYSADHTALVYLSRKDKHLLVVVEDQGIGIERSERDRIFQPFYRVEENSNAEGFGLGLSLADKIVKIHKGRIEIDSEKDRGTRFFIFLPAAGTTA